MINRATLAIVLLVSLAHALVHVYENALPSVEQEIAAEYYSGDSVQGKRFTGRLSYVWRLMWGVGAIVAGWLVDRFGSRRLLVIYLWGCSLTCGLAALVSTEQGLFLVMMLMGALASIYHPAGLALISHETTEENRLRSLGLHGILGSAGIGLTPLSIGLLMDANFDWRQVYLALLLPGIVLGGVILFDALRRRQLAGSQKIVPKSEERLPDYRSFFVLTLLAAIQGFVYSGLMSFLVRYLNQNGQVTNSGGNYWASGVLLMGCIGQYIAGRWAKPNQLERQVTIITFGNVPLLLWMSVAEGGWRPASAGLLALVHFMHQPLYNSLIAKYTPRHRRSLCYGFSFAMGLGLGSFGALFAGYTMSDLILYGGLGLMALGGGFVGLVLCGMQKQ
jgi:FSR family fosmidomycin resistance protein-like MFS transporter